MGTKRTWKRKHLFLYITCLITMLYGIQGCAHFKNLQANFKHWQAKRKLAGAMALMFNGNYKESLEDNKEVLRLFPQTFGDQALFQMGLNYAHPENPDTNYQKSIESFQSIIVEYSKSRFRDEAAIWILLLRKVEAKDKKIDDFQHQIENLEDQIKKLKEIDLGIEEKKRKDLLK